MILIIGDNDENFKAEDFVPFYFKEEFIAFQWPPKETFYSREKLKKEIFQIIKEKKILTLIIYLNQDPIFYEKEFIALSSHVVIIGVFYDDTFTPRYSLEASHYCDYVLTADITQLARYQSIGVPSALHIGNINAESFKMKKISRDIDILFYGTNDKGRKDKYKYIKQNLNEYKILDVTNSKERVPQNLFINQLNRSKITINFSGSRLDTLLNNFGDPLVPHYQQFKGRIVESTLMGCICFTDDESNNNTLLTLKFNNLEDLVTKLKDILKKPELIETLSIEGHATALTYLKSIQKPLETYKIVKRRRIILKNSIVDKVSATLSLDNAILNLKHKKFGNFALDVTQIPFSKVNYRYLWKRKIQKILYSKISRAIKGKMNHER